MAKAVDLNSVRQQIVRVLYDTDGPIKAAAIIKELKKDGIDASKVVHSHLQAFKGMKNPKVTHDIENGTYELTTSGREKYEADVAEQAEPELVEA